MLSFAKFVASLFYIGYLPKAPGTFGSFFTCAILCFFCNYLSVPLLIGVFIALSLIGYFSSYIILKHNMDDVDPSFIVIDEVIGLVICSIGLILFLYRSLTIPILLINTILFRFFDIIKPWPISWIEKKLNDPIHKATFGILLDDITAGIMAFVTFLLLVQFIPQSFLF
ncbi:MAG: phosphatidylglycerophosphatase A family protein [Alphaproteobacteria bacterium]